ncbi:MAG TPA: DUF2306 domain-containing protein [Roseiarcus sp.]|nr:DUF2306 domain-containing protein [Roseiarcus sp.]
MTLAPLLASPAHIIIHASLATAALIIGAAVLFLRKGTPLHKALGRIWAALMMATAALSFAITSLNPGHFSAIHILSIVTLITIPYAVWRRRMGDIRAHATAMVANYCGLFVAGAFTLAPGRILHAVIFG